LKSGFISNDFYFYAIKVKEVIVECLWKFVQDTDDGYWDTQCGHSHMFFSGRPEENDYKFCPYCGKPIKEEE
jgi:hypothetical protein